MSNKRFSEFVESILKSSGWFPNRNMGDTVLKWEQELHNSDGFNMFSDAEKVLLEFGGLVVNQRGAGKTCAREPFRILPTLAIYEGDRFIDYSHLLNIKLYPLGEAFDGHYFLAIGEDGRIFLIMDDIQMIGRNFDEALENLIIGIEPQKIKSEQSVNDTNQE